MLHACISDELHVMYIMLMRAIYHRRSSIKDVRKKCPFFYPLTPVRRCPHLTNSPPCGRPHSTLYTALWSGSAIAGAVDFPHLTRTPCGLTCGHLTLRARGVEVCRP